MTGLLSLNFIFIIFVLLWGGGERGGEGEEGTLVDRRLMASLWLSYFETKGKRKQ